MNESSQKNFFILKEERFGEIKKTLTFANPKRKGAL